MNNKDKFRLYFTWRDQLYEKWIDITYPPDLLNNSEHKQAYIFNKIVPKNLIILKQWYKEITGENYPENYNIPLREIVVNKDISAEEAIRLADNKKI